MEIYLVGGAVRDTLLGLPVKDRDWVVVGGTPQQLLAQGYTPVGRDFPVFLHPVTHEQVALARTERKTAPGYQGFAIHAAPDVTLEQDLARRDLTINAMAVPQAQTDAAGNFDPRHATLIDPYGGRADLAARQLRHVTDAFREDPVRILRIARFAARFADFRVTLDTLALMQAMVAQGEAAALVAERVWQELSSGLMAGMPSRMLLVLQACDALDAVLPELAASSSALCAHALDMLDRCAALDVTLEVRFACLCLHVPAVAQGGAGTIRRLCERLKVPTHCRDLSELAARERSALQTCTDLDAEGLVGLLERCDAFRKPGRIGALMQVMACDTPDWSPGTAYPARDVLLAALDAARAVRTEPVVEEVRQAGLGESAIGPRMHLARVRAVAATREQTSANAP
ncbi:MAG: multifunctional CCA tRNA nucleotidyl transferase/2'3'-cyclic phosphodiesterase/2'nucleotidase/phosphatase [Rhodoferax sp.]|nr:multifunctional CCA tRNA nucleotidyl transferase/2'3'-cyclic phosphodiesterase/2'nucleotidase/phosphatase [Rhodoferax sp.]